MVLYPEEDVKQDKLGMYRYPTRLTRPGSGSGHTIKSSGKRSMTKNSQDLLPPAFRRAASRFSETRTLPQLLHLLYL